MYKQTIEKKSVGKLIILKIADKMYNSIFVGQYIH